jgi:hypothetical protein
LIEAIRQIYQHAISEIRIEGVDVVPYGWFNVMDGRDASLYVAGVEPSAKGCAAMARGVLPLVIADRVDGVERRRVRVRRRVARNNTDDDDDVDDDDDANDNDDDSN